jgi:acetylornithine deacetylase/succinyl-diaminopimelate desuccinylase-like protein
MSFLPLARFSRISIVVTRIDGDIQNLFSPLKTSNMANQSFRSHLTDQLSLRESQLVSAAQCLLAAPSPNPPGETALVAEAAINIPEKIPGAEIERYETAPGLVNLVARIPSGRASKRLVFNGHLDTFPICEHLDWTVPPLSGHIKNGKLYGRGISDMKGGIAA